MQGNDSNASIDDGCPYASITDAREAHQRFHDARAVRQRPAADDDRGGSGATTATRYAPALLTMAFDSTASG
ncbi:hypothetical protein DF021_01970 [Burkholderia stagnalis]|uniref:Uncharacterized protein n=1 Tax=Burkholderia stagnalis TaxID=1503054 RepID=A0ABX9YVY3_9BURK|nr:hypothetical protein WT33_26475 [Burkholderia stagnalis]RQQ66555.1 hypothetical protein DF158_02080 [Burkholderia stagnalis]RQQ69353.1 hypothetical protein DF137_13735 [Burkholderia stagnalis]RQQ70377.1 hypothetical protein DF139_12840 [Burkholderia stagnalis]RQQ81801.1 hypothetical protein DF138_12100 [Burkholderia stagnalis]